MEYPLRTKIKLGSLVSCFWNIMYTFRTWPYQRFFKSLGPPRLGFFFHCTESFCREPYAEIKAIFPIELWELGIRNSRNAEDLVRATCLTNKLPFISDTGVLKPLLTSKRHDKLRY